jgi:hypothetical protein
MLRRGVLGFTGVVVAAYTCFCFYSFINDLMHGSPDQQAHFLPPKTTLIDTPIQNFLARRNILEKFRDLSPLGEEYAATGTHNLIRMNQTRHVRDWNTSEEEFSNTSAQTTGATALAPPLSSSESDSQPAEFWDGPRWSNVLNAPVHQCAGNVRDISVIDTGRSMMESVRNHQRTVISIAPAELMRYWGTTDLANEYETAYRGGWYRRAAEWIEKMPLEDLRATAKNGKPMYAGLPALALEGRFREAAMSISFHLNGSNVNEPLPGILVLRNALFTESTQAMHEYESTSSMTFCSR